MSLMNQCWVEWNKPSAAGSLLTISYYFSTGTLDFPLYFGSVSNREGSVLPPPLSPPPSLCQLWASRMWVCQSTWNSFKVNEIHTWTRRMCHCLTWRIITFERKLEMSRVENDTCCRSNEGTDWKLRERHTKPMNRIWKELKAAGCWISHPCQLLQQAGGCIPNPSWPLRTASFPCVCVCVQFILDALGVIVQVFFPSTTNFTFPQWHDGAQRQRVFIALQTHVKGSFVFCVIRSGNGATSHRAGLPAEVAGPRDGQSCHSWQDGLDTQHPRDPAAVR